MTTSMITFQLADSVLNLFNTNVGVKDRTTQHKMQFQTSSIHLVINKGVHLSHHLTDLESGNDRPSNLRGCWDQK